MCSSDLLRTTARGAAMRVLTRVVGMRALSEPEVASQLAACTRVSLSSYQLMAPDDTLLRANETS